MKIMEYIHIPRHRHPCQSETSPTKANNVDWASEECKLNIAITS